MSEQVPPVGGSFLVRQSFDRYPHVRKPGDDGRCGYCGQREGVCPGLNGGSTPNPAEATEQNANSSSSNNAGE